jgi:hypothetical protein
MTRQSFETEHIVTGRTMLARDIATEFWVPIKPSGKAIVLLDGVPSVPSKHKLALFLAKKGYWVFHPRYRGTWESRGNFLAKSPIVDVRDVVRAIPQGFTDVWTKLTYYVELCDVTVIGSSFAGPAVIHATTLSEVNRAVALAPVVDWHARSPKEPFDEFVRIVLTGYPGAYRVTRAGLHKLLKPGFYDPQSWIELTRAKKLLIVHAKDDDVVPVQPTKKFAQATKALCHILPEGGHLSASAVMHRDVWPAVRLFLKQNTTQE